MMYYKNQVPNLFYELKYDFTVYDQFFYDVLVTTMLPCMIYSHTIFPAPTILFPSRTITMNERDSWVHGKQNQFLCFPIFAVKLMCLLHIEKK